MNVEEIAKYIVEDLPMPDGCSVLAEASAQSELPEGCGLYQVRRNLSLDVSDLMPPGIVNMPDAPMCSDDEVFYLKFQTKIRREFAQNVLNIFKYRRNPLGTLRLTSHSGEGTEVYFFPQGILIVRSEIADQEDGRTSWKIDLLLGLNRVDR